MSTVSTADDIWVLRPTKADLMAGARYALVTLPWTFNRMMLNTGSKGQQGRALNIAKGVVGQEMVRRELTRRGKHATIQRKSHRDEDRLDLYAAIDGELKRLDVKTNVYFTDYAALGRTPLSSKLIIDNADYGGPEWSHFFPMLVPHTQIGQDKEAYCFAIASSIDFRNNHLANRSAELLAAFPFGELLPFLSSSKLCKAREEDSKGFHLALQWAPSLLDPPKMKITIIGEWDGEAREVEVLLKNGKESTAGPFSVVSAFTVDGEGYRAWVHGSVAVSVKSNGFARAILNSARTNLNVIPKCALRLTHDDFCNLILPSDYTLYTVGWTTKHQFISGCRRHKGWVWPIDSVNKWANSPWSQITEKDEASITRAGFADCIQRKPSMIRAGWMKTNGRGGGACCYFYPNIGMNGGVKETNLYTLPHDLFTVASLE